MNSMKKIIYHIFVVMFTLLPMGACTDSSMGDDPEEPFVDPIPVEDIEKESVPMFTNPLINADMPDASVVRVGDDYYMAGTTMHMVPGVAILHSKDLVGWEIVGHVFDNFLGDSPAARFEADNDFFYDEQKHPRRDLYSQGSWASSLAYHDGYFYCLWNIINGDKSYISRTKDPAGTWEIVQTYEPLFYDAALFFDDDGTAYIFKAHGETITKLNSDFSINSVVYDFSNDRGIYTDSEGYHVRKVDGYYYIFMIMWVDVPSVICLRSKTIDGPYTERLVLSSYITTTTGEVAIGSTVAQGSIIDTPDGKWYGMFGTNLGSVGRAPVLVECNFKNGWPVFGNEQGKVDEEMAVPVPVGNFASASMVVKSDEFVDKKLHPFWEWNHCPDKDKWSLNEKPGHLRLTTGHIATDFYHARNTLTCRTTRPSCRGDISVDFSHMKDGDYAGLGMMQYRSGLVGVKKVNGKHYIFMSKGVQNDGLYEATNDGDVSGAMTEYAEIEIDQTIAQFRVSVNFDTNLATFYYSLGNNRWTQIGETMKMTYLLSNFVGNRFAIFNYATQQTGGYVDVDSFTFVRRY